MRFINYLIIAFVFLKINGGFLFSEEIDDSFTVTLKTENLAWPLYLFPLQDNSSSVVKTETTALEKTLHFDLDHNGSTTIAKQTKEANLLCGQGEGGIGSVSAWRDQRIFYVVKPKIDEKGISAVVLDVEKKQLKNIGPLPLTGEITEDRKSVHRLADLIHKAFFGSLGIASSHILYTVKNCSSKDSSQWTSEVYEMDFDGGNNRKITEGSKTAVTPSYFPAKSGCLPGSFIYVSYEMGIPKIYVAARKDGSRVRLNKMRGNQLMPTVSKQRDKIAFVCDITGNPDLYIQPINVETGAKEKPYQIFAAPHAAQGSPTFSPDGSQIAFVSNKDGSPKIYVMKVPKPGTLLKNIKASLITCANRENTAPAWSPDGKKIAYSAKGSGERQIWIYDIATRKEMPLTKGSGNKENPAWASDSLHIVYNSSDNKSCDIYLIDLNGSDPVRLTSGPGEKRFPSFE